MWMISAVLWFISCFLTETSCNERRAVCYVQPDPNSSQAVTGVVLFSQKAVDKPINISVRLSGFQVLSPTANSSSYLHGFHVHEFGDLTGGCLSTGGHYNPDKVNHGGPSDSIRHAGDFGNLRQTRGGTLQTTFTDSMASLYGDKSIIGRAIVVHGGVDDLGKGVDASSLTNGNAGPRLACCVIGNILK